MKYCPNCKQMVKPVKTPWSWGWFLAWILTAGIVYIAYHLFLKRKNKCPICGLKVVRRKPKEEAA